MNICIYTSSRPSISNLLNIGYLINKRPVHNYSFIVVDVPSKSMTLTEKLKKFYGEKRFDDGRFDLQHDLSLLERQLQPEMQHIDTSKFKNTHVAKVNDAESEKFLTDTLPDVIIQAGAGIIKENIFTKSKIATINVHHGIAPEIRGIDSTFWCMFYGVPEKIGVTCHFIDEHLDTGAVISRKVLATNARSFVDVQAENFLMGREVLTDSIDILEKGNYVVENKGVVESYYFGIVDAFLYYALKKRNFKPLMKISQKAYKMKELNVLVQK